MAEDRFGKIIEREDGVDFPFYNGTPIDLPQRKWILILVSVAVGFAALLLIPQANNYVALIPRTLFLAIPLLTLYLLTGKYWKELFRRVRLSDVVQMVLFAILNLAITLVVGSIVKSLFGSSVNPAVDKVSEGGVGGAIAFYLGTGIQIVGEEVFTILPFLAFMFLFFRKFGLSRKKAIIWSWVLSSLWFGAAHLPTYQWNFIQALVTIGSARIALTLAYIRTKNLWVASGAHIIFDWFIFALG